MEKTKHPRATLEQKIAVLDYYHDSLARNAARPSQADVVKHFQGKIAISTSSFSEWVKGEAELRELFNHPSGAHKRSKRKLRFKYAEINDAMAALVQERMKEGKPVTEPWLREHWVVLAHRHGVDDPKRLLGFSHGWLTQFKKRHGLDRHSRAKLRQKKPVETPMMLDELSDDYMLQNYESLIGQGTWRNVQPLQLVPQVVPQVSQQVVQAQDNMVQQENSIHMGLSDTDFELILDKYGDEFAALSRDKYPQSAHMFDEFLKSYKSEREANSERKLRELMRR